MKNLNFKFCGFKNVSLSNNFIMIKEKDSEWFSSVCCLPANVSIDSVLWLADLNFDSFYNDVDSDKIIKAVKTLEHYSSKYCA